MRYLLAFTLLLTTVAATAQTTVNHKTLGPLKFMELEHGLATTVPGSIVPDEKSPTRTRGWLQDFAIVKVTDTIALKQKVVFGVVYIIEAKDTADVNVQIEWVYPQKITNNEGESFKAVKYTTQRPTNFPSASSYSLDEPYEMVKGKWTLRLWVEGKKVLERGFWLE